MIHSMTAFGSARADLEQGSLALEIRSVNSRFLDLSFRLPDELRHVEAPLRDMLTSRLGRGKVELRANYTRNADNAANALDANALGAVAEQLRIARTAMPDLPAPRLIELLNWPGLRSAESFDSEAWGAACVQAADQALAQLRQARAREGERLAEVIRSCAQDMETIIDEVETHLPQMLEDHRNKLGAKLRDTLTNAFPGGLAHIGGAELSERLAQETSLFALRIDVAEELARLRSHVTELQHILRADDGVESSAAASRASVGGSPASADANAGSRAGDAATGGGGKGKPAGKRAEGSAGKRLDFLFQEMNREANTLGSKAASLTVTRAAMDLKLLIEQMREQAANIE